MRFFASDWDPRAGRGESGDREWEGWREEGWFGGRASLSPRGETESVPMIGCIPRERGLEERVDRGGEAFNTCGTVLPLSIKRIGWITISTPRWEKEREKKSPLRSLKKYPPTDREISDMVRCSWFSMRNYLVSLTLIMEIENLILKRLYD